MRRRAILAMASTASGGVGLLAIAWLATRHLSAAELGFFFSFLGLGALVQLADFGLSYAALQTGGRLAGTQRLDEIPALARRVSRWNIVTTLVSSTLVAIIGWAMFSSGRATPAASPVAWRNPWLVYVASVFLAQLVTPGISLREGSGKITQMWRLRLVQEWTSAASCLLALYAGAGLWSLAAFSSARAAVGGFWLIVGDPLRPGTRVTDFSLKQWMAEVWPFQWKIGLSALSGFLIFRAFSPIILLEKGPILAGQFGLAISMMNLLISVSSAWPLSQAAHFSALNAAKRYAELRREFPIMLAASTALCAAAAVALAIGLWEARRLGVIFALRMPDPVTTAIVLAAAVAHHVVACFAVFLRAEGREPLLIVSVVGSVATAAALWLAAHFGTLRDVATTNLGLALLGIPIVYLILHQRRHFLSTARSAAERFQL